MTRTQWLWLFVILAVQSYAIWYVGDRAQNQREKRIAVERKGDERLRTTEREALRATCERGDIARAWFRWDARQNTHDPDGRGAVADKLFPILDCTLPPPFEPLSPARQQAYIDRVIRNAGGQP